MEGIELPNQEKIRMPGEKNHEYLEISEADTIKQAEMKKKWKCESQMNEKTS